MNTINSMTELDYNQEAAEKFRSLRMVFLKNILASYEKKIKMAGAIVERFDWHLTMSAIFPGQEKGIYVCYLFRPERDGAEGYKLITEETLDQWLNENELP